MRDLLSSLLILASLARPCFVGAQANHLPGSPFGGEPVSRSLSGVVLDPSGAAIAAAHMMLHQPDQSTPVETETDATGAFHFDHIHIGKYDIEVQAGGFHDGILNDRPAGTARNTMPGPGVIDLDVNLSHDFHLSKSKKELRVLSLSLNSFNVLNYPNYVTY